MVKLLQSPGLFDPLLNQTEIDLSKQKVNLINRETELIKIICQAQYELSTVQNLIKNIDSQNEFAQMTHNLNLRRQRNGN